MFEKLGKRALAAPLGVAIVLCLFLSLVLCPIMRMSPSDVPFVFVNLDDGASIAGSELNIGDELEEALLSGDADSSSLAELAGTDDDGSDDTVDGEDSADATDDGTDGGDETATTSDFSSVSTSVTIAWAQMGTEEEAVEALDGLDYYGAFVIPEDFTAQYLSYSVGVGEAPEITVYLNAGKNAAMATTMSTVLMEAMLQADVAVDVQTINSVDIGGGTMSSAMVVQLMVMPLIVMSLVPSILTAVVFWKADVTGLRRKSPLAAAIVMVLLIGVFSAANAGLDLFIDSVAGGMDLPLGELFPFLWISSFCMMLACTGLCALCLPLGALMGVLTLGLGMSTALFGPEMLPDFWANYIYPWAPQAYIGNGIRLILFFGQDPFSLGTTHLVVMAAIGVVAIALACVAAFAKKRKEGDAAAAGDADTDDTGEVDANDAATSSDVYEAREDDAANTTFNSEGNGLADVSKPLPIDR